MTHTSKFATPWARLPSSGSSTLSLSLLAGLLFAPGAVFAACQPDVTATSFAVVVQDSGSTCVYTGDPVTVTVNAWTATGLVQSNGSTTFNGALTINDTNGNNSRGILIQSGGAGTFRKSVTVIKTGGENNAAGIEASAASGVAALTMMDDTFVTSHVANPPAGIVNTRDGVRNNPGGVSNYQKGLSITSQGYTRSGLYVGGNTVTVGGNLLLDFQSDYTTSIYAALWSQGGTTEVNGTSTITTATNSGSAPAVMVANSTVTLNGLADITAAGPGSPAVDVRNGGIAAMTMNGNTIKASGAGASGIGVQIRGNGAFSAGTGLTVATTGTSFNYLGATALTVTGSPMAALDNVTAITAPVVWRADATSVATYTGTGGHYKGSSQLAAGGQLALNLANSALWEATAASSFTQLSLQSNAILDASLLTTLPATGNLTNAGGLVSLARTDTTPTNTLDLAGTYTANGGTLALNTVLNNASTSISDVLRVTSTVAGGAPTVISVIPDAASTPALTTGKGILVVQVTGGAGSSAPGAFVLAGNYLDAAGIRYELVRDATDGNWYLQALTALPSLSINNVSLLEGNVGTTLMSFTVNLSAPAPAGGVQFDIATADGTATQGSDYIAQSLTAQTIPAGSTSYTFSVQINGDTDVEPDETFFVNISNVIGAAVTNGQGTGTIVNDDAVTPPNTGNPIPVPLGGVWSVLMAALMAGFGSLVMQRKRKKSV